MSFVSFVEDVFMESDFSEIVQIARTRGNAYRLLSRLWGIEIDAELWQQLQATSFPELPEAPELNVAYRQLKRALQEPAAQALPALAADYAVMCLGADQTDGADPYESVHRSKDHIMMQDEWEQVLCLYAELGLERSNRTKEPEDHLALELDCMAHLCEREAEALEGARPDEAGWAADRQREFLDKHLLLWVPSFAHEVLRLAHAEFYRAIAIITREQLILDRALLDELTAPAEVQARGI